MKMWEIRDRMRPEHFEDDERHYRGGESDEYETGFEAGYRKAMKEAKKYYEEEYRR